jgi:type VI secretion system protein VasJ
MLRQGLEILRNAASLYREKDPSDTTSYRLTRITAWLGVEMLPAAQEGKTRIPPPMEQVKSSLNNLHSQGNFKDLLEYAESRVGQFLFWLDLSRYVADALEQFGYDRALDVVTEETAHYAHRLKGIEKLTFSDGTPFADEVTRQWIKRITKDENAPEAPQFVPLTSTANNIEDTRISETYAQAQTLLKDKKLFEALDLLQKDLDGAGTERSKFLKRISLARLLISAQKPRLALPHLLEILEDIDRHGLETWNPDLTLKAFLQVYSGLRTQKEEVYQERAADVLDRIARLNVVAAIRVEE